MPIDTVGLSTPHYPCRDRTNVSHDCCARRHTVLFPRGATNSTGDVLLDRPTRTDVFHVVRRASHCIVGYWLGQKTSRGSSLRELGHRHPAIPLLSPAAAGTDWGRPIPHCPEWDAAELVRHTGSVLEWMGAIITSRERVIRRTLDPAPDQPADPSAWYLSTLDRTLNLLASTDPESTTWTFSTPGNRRVAWWIRRLAVEVAVHRWDVEHAVGADGSAPRPVDRGVATAGIGEFVVEFLPELLSQESVVGLHGTLQLQSSDGGDWWWTDLGARSSSTEIRATATRAIRATTSDLLLCLNNRRADTLQASGGLRIFDEWQQLRF